MIFWIYIGILTSSPKHHVGICCRRSPWAVHTTKAYSRAWGETETAQASVNIVWIQWFCFLWWVFFFFLMIKRWWISSIFHFSCQMIGFLRIAYGFRTRKSRKRKWQCCTASKCISKLICLVYPYGLVSDLCVVL